MKRFEGDRRLRWFRFHPTEYLADLNLMSCSLGAQGLWMRLICMMTQSERYGVLMLHGKPISTPDLAQLLRIKPRIVGPLLDELNRQQVYSVDPDGFIFSRRMVREFAQNQVDRDFGKQGGNGALVPPLPDKPEPDPVPPMDVANDRTPVRPRPKGRETWAKRPRNVDETDAKLVRNVGETCAKLVRNVGETCAKRVRNVGETYMNGMTINNDINDLSQIRVNPMSPDRVKAETETETELEKEKERNSAAGIGAVARDTLAHAPVVTLDNVIELRAVQPDIIDPFRPAQPSLAIHPIARRPAVEGMDPGPARRSRGERTAPDGDRAMQADESRALASWNTLAAATGMVPGTMNAITRRRIRTILAIGGGLQGWDTALAAAETAPHWNGTGTSDWRPTIGSFCKPDLFAKLVNGAYAPRERREQARPMSNRDRATIAAMDRIMGRAVGDGE